MTREAPQQHHRPLHAVPPMASPVFNSARHALGVSFLMAVLPASMRSPTWSAIEYLMREAGVVIEDDRNGDRPLNFAGLSAMEVRAQCAMVTAAVRDHLPEPEWRAIEAWYAHDARKAEAVSYLCDWCGPHWTIESRPARMLVTWRANVTDGSKAARFCSVRDIEGEHGIPKSTAQRQVAKISKVCSSLRQHGIAQLEALFEAGGLIEGQGAQVSRAA